MSGWQAPTSTPWRAKRSTADNGTATPAASGIRQEKIRAGTRPDGADPSGRVCVGPRRAAPAAGVANFLR
jgi:hypothetical protein